MLEGYVCLIQDMYVGVAIIVKTKWDYSKVFPVNVGLYQSSLLNPFWFIVVLDMISETMQREPHWNMMFADDLVISAKDCEMLQTKFEQW